MIEENVKKLLGLLPATNPLGEELTLVAAVKTQPVEAINRAICAGVRVIGDNHAQEVRDKYDQILGNPQRHFIGHLQLNKLKYLIGKIDLYHSVDRLELAEEISKRSLKAQVTSRLLLQVNIGNEESKSGFELDVIDGAVEKVCALPAVKVEGLMAMLPDTDDGALLKALATKMREKYDALKGTHPDFKYLSMGMSGDWKICVECGSNMIRLGTAIFGQRHYDK